jgi:hypothetical protein
MKPGKLITAASRLRCILFHQPSWALYAGARFVYCQHCDQTYGHPNDHIGRAIGIGDATDAEVMLAKQQVYGVMPSGLVTVKDYVDDLQSESMSDSHDDVSWSPSPSVSLSPSLEPEDDDLDLDDYVEKIRTAEKARLVKLKREPYVDPVLPDGKTRKIDLE